MRELKNVEIKKERFEDYNVVSYNGYFEQDRINGLLPKDLNNLMEAVDPLKNRVILDLMGGNGNLIHTMNDYCFKNQIDRPHCTLFELSRVQVEEARMKLPETSTEFLHADVLTWETVRERLPIVKNHFDAIMMKSGNHEIPMTEQRVLYKNIIQALKPGGVFVNLGFCFDDGPEAEELARIATIKDHYAGMQGAAVNRHFLTRQQLYTNLEDVGMVGISCVHKFDYVIKSDVVAENYFETLKLISDEEHQVEMVRAKRMRRANMIHFNHDKAIMTPPGEITVAYRPK